MKKERRKLPINVYIELKNELYKQYIIDIRHPELNRIEEMFKELEQYSEPVLDTIVGDTIEFPFDKELTDFFERNRKMGLNELATTACNIFGIDLDLVASKIKEYSIYNYHKLLQDGSINPEYVDELSQIYLDRNLKNIKK